jgi:uncharacterized ion transporter superfamily protein YfcC
MLVLKAIQNTMVSRQFFLLYAASKADEKRAKSTEAKKQKEAENQHKMAHEEVAEKERVEKLLAVLQVEMTKGIYHIMKQNMPRLKDILIY